MLKIIEELSKAGGERNEDFYAYNENTILLLDGSSGLSPDSPDARRFVKEYARLFMDKMAQTDDLCRAVNEALSELSVTHLKKKSGADLLPSASLMAVQLKDNKLRILSIGDCTAVIKTKNDVFTVYCDEVEAFDNDVKNEAMKIREETGKDICEIMQSPHIKKMLYTNRLKMNADDGYEILAFNMSARNENHIVEFDVTDIIEAVVFTDGFDEKKKELSSQNRPSLSQLYHKLREDEKADSTLNKTPRFKMGDDATAVVFKIV